jgi:hypothetical protein
MQHFLSEVIVIWESDFIIKCSLKNLYRYFIVQVQPIDPNKAQLKVECK